MEKTENIDKIWIWPQANGLSFKVVSNPKKGIITVYDANGKKIMHHEGLSEEQVKIIEEQFLKIVTRKHKTTRKTFDPMIS